MQWYYAVGEERRGPVEQAELVRLAETGLVTADTLVWRQGMASWQRYAEVAAGAGLPVAGAAADPDTEICVMSGKRYPRREMMQYEGKWVSAEHREAFLQRLREGVALPVESVVPGPYGYAGFWRRFLAAVVDGLILAVVGMFFGGTIGGIWGATGTLDPNDPGSFIAMQLVVQAVSIVIAIGYDVLFIRKFDATPGKMALGVKVLRADGSKLSVGRIIGRYFAKILSGIILAIGYIMAAFDDEKRGLHDRICDTRVIKSRA